MDPVIVPCGPSSRNQVHIFSVNAALEKNFVDNNLSVRDTHVIALVENKVTGAAVFTSCTVLGCDRGHPEGHWTSTPLSHSLFALARNMQTAHSGRAPPTGTKGQIPDLERSNDVCCMRTSVPITGDRKPFTK